MKTNGIVRSWSYSALSQYEKCPAQYKYARIERRPQPPSAALERGNEVHSQLEAEMRKPKVTELPSKFEALSNYIRDLRERSTIVEEMWYLDSDWRFLGSGQWKQGTWLILKMDVYAKREVAGGRAKAKTVKRPLVVDWKTGKKYDDHFQQAQLYSLGAVAYEPNLPEDEHVVDVDMVYTDQGEVDGWEFDLRGGDGEETRQRWTERAMRLFTETRWGAKPSFKACNWCPFSGRKKGPCRAG